MSRNEYRLGRLESAGTPNPVPAAKAAVALPIPNIIDFVTGPEYLNRPRLYPRQATLLKIIMLEVDLLTDYDRAVIADWESGFRLVDRDAIQGYEGERGLAPGTVQRMLACRAEGRSWFREVVLVLGRRAGKGYLSSLVTAYVLWQLLTLGDPQEALGIEQTKQLVIMTMAAELSQAVSNQHRDIVELLLNAPCFAQFIGPHSNTSLRLRTPAELASDPDAEGSLLVQARPATANAGRGPTAVACLFDEMAHAPASGLQRGADEIYRGAAPALAQFPTRSLMMLASSPASQTGEFFAAYRRGLHTTSGHPQDPSMIVVQLPSGGPYEDWGLTQTGLAMYPGGPDFAPLDRAIISEDTPYERRLAVSNGDTYRVEHLAHWRSSLTAYLDPDLVAAVFASPGSTALTRQSAGLPNQNYVMHCDTSTSGANTAIAIGHLEGGPAPDGDVIFDYLHAYQPGDFPEGRIDYSFIQSQLCQLIIDFSPAVVSFDSYNSEQLVQQLRAWSRETRGFARLDIRVRVPTATRNWIDAERFKTLMGAGRIRAHPHDLAKNELLFLEVSGITVDHPRAGPVTTSDVSDSMFNVVAQLMDSSAGVLGQLSAQRLHGSHPGGFGISEDQAIFSQLGAGRGRASDVPRNPAWGSRFRR